VRRELRPVVDAFWPAASCAGRIWPAICHPGGARVMDALETRSARLRDDADRAWRARDFGNMSAVTVLFVLERMLRDRRPGRYLMSALGPGFTAGFQLVQVT
jgi:alkylresorcinol/alkylpyrone synthase